MPQPAPLPPGRLFAWLGLVAFASGVPNALVTDTAPLLYGARGVDLTQIGLFSALTLGWPLKVFLAPLVDRFGVRRRWIPLVQLLIALLLLVVATLPGDSLPLAAWVAFSLVALAGGLQDVAIDGYAVDATPAGLMGPAGGVRTAFYRIALAVAGGTLVARAPWLGWSGTWQAAAALMAGLALASACLPEAPRQRAPRVALVAPIGALFARRSWLAFLLFVLLYKIGDRAMAPMTKQFLRAQGFSLAELGDVLTPLIIVSTLLGALLGGLLTRRWGPIKALVLLGLAQALSNLGYAAAAAFPGRPLEWSAALVEPFCGGLGSAPFVALFMLACQRAHAATQYAFLTAIMGLVGGAIGIPSGWMIEKTGLGFANYFLLTGLVALPPLLLLPGVARWLADAPPAQAAPAASA